MSNYLRRLETTLNEQGFHGECLVTRSGGGAMAFGEAEARPFETIMSGPVAGAVGAGELCRDLGIEQAITADVGGTSFDTCLISGGRPQVKYEGKVVGMPIQSPWVDVRSIGAGGGSIAYVDAGGLLRVGPHSAGAVPGPVCYRRGGTEATVTDAAAVLGMLAFGELAGGVTLDFDGAGAAVARLGDRLGLSVHEAAQGILTIANAAMANAIRSVTIEQGQDPRQATLIAFGGAGPLFGTLLARELDITEILVPNYAGNFSAWGLLGQDLTRSAALTSIRRLDAAALDEANTVLGTLFDRLRERGNGSRKTETLEPALDLRYAGQEYTLTVHPPASDGLITAGPDEVASVFTRDYDRTFGHTLSEPIEIVSIRSTSREPLPRKASERVLGDGPGTGGPRSIEAHSFTRGTTETFSVVDRSALSIESTLSGPAIVLEPTTTTYVDAGFELEVHTSGTLFIRDVEVAR